MMSCERQLSDGDAKIPRCRRCRGRRRRRRPRRGHHARATTASTTLLVEQRLEPPHLPRATVISTRSMELLRSWRLEQEVLAGGVDADVWLWECETLARAAEASAHAGRAIRRAQQAAVVSPPRRAPCRRTGSRRCCAGTSTRCRRHDSSWAPQLVAVDEARRGARSTLETGRATCARVRAQYLLAADGAHSPIRGMLGVEMREWEGAYGGVQVVFRAPLAAARRAFGTRCTSSRRRTAPGVFLPAGRGDRWVYGPAGRGRRARPDLDPRDSPTRSRRVRVSPTSIPRSSACRPVPFAWTAGGAVPRRADVPRRRRRPSCDATRRHRDEHRPAERLRPRLEAGLGGAAAGRRRSCWTPTRRSAGWSPSTTSPARPIRTAAAVAVRRRARASTWAAVSRTPGFRRRPARSPRSISSDPDGRCSPDHLATARLPPLRRAPRP